MKITDVKARAIRMPFVEGDLPLSLRTERTFVIVKVSTDQGIDGFGEAFGFFNAAPATASAVETMLKPMLLGKDPTEIQKLWDQMGKRFEPFRLYWYEEPVWPGDDYEGLAQVRAAVDIPLAAGENEYTARAFENLIARRAVDVLQPSVFKLGGILQEKKVFTLAHARGFKVMPHCISFGPAMAATIHACFSEPDSELIETAVDTPQTPILREPLLPDQGHWKISDKAGLGIELDEDVLERFTMR